MFNITYVSAFSPLLMFLISCYYHVHILLHTPVVKCSCADPNVLMHVPRNDIVSIYRLYFILLSYACVQHVYAMANEI